MEACINMKTNKPPLKQLSPAAPSNPVPLHLPPYLPPPPPLHKHAHVQHTHTRTHITTWLTGSAHISSLKRSIELWESARQQECIGKSNKREREKEEEKKRKRKKTKKLPRSINGIQMGSCTFVNKITNVASS